MYAELKALTKQTRWLGGELVDTISLSSPAEMISLASQYGRKWRGSGQWEGLESQQKEDFFNTQISTAALKYFESATDSLKRDARTGGRLIPAVSGGAWIVPRVLQSHPMAAMRRPRAHLPPKHITLFIDLAGWASAQEVARLGAIIARSLWEYQLAGGIVSLNLLHAERYPQFSRHGTLGLIIETAVPLSDENSFALACSTPLERACAIPLAGTLGETDHIRLFNKALPPEYLRISGNIDADMQELARFGFFPE